MSGVIKEGANWERDLLLRVALRRCAENGLKQKELCNYIVKVTGLESEYVRLYFYGRTVSSKVDGVLRWFVRGDREWEDRDPVDVKRRCCLGCGKMFLSYHRGNRMCRHCRKG